jgi:DNA-binding transcriptional LysR family regulator
MDTLDLMRVFVRVCEVESFTGAAESLNMPKASISQYVQKLEASLDTRLLHRTTRKVTITQDGMTFYDRCKDLLADVDEVENMFNRNETNVSGRIRVDMPTNLAKNYVIKRLPEFLEKYPNIEVELSSTDRKVDLIKEGFDCVIRIGNLSDSGLIAKKVTEFSILNCVSPSYIKKFGTPKKLDDLAKHFEVHYSSTLGAKPDGFEYFDGEKYATIKMKGLITVNNSDAYMAACLAGLGIIQVPTLGARPLIKEGLLVEVLPKLKAEPMPVSVVYPHRRNLSRRVRIFIEWVDSIIGSLT